MVRLWPLISPSTTAPVVTAWSREWPVPGLILAPLVITKVLRGRGRDGGRHRGL